MNLWRRHTRRLLLLCASLTLFSEAKAQTPTWQMVHWQHGLAVQRPSAPFDYQPQARAAKAWHLCVVYPHLKDAYWLSVNFGMTQEAERQGVTFELLEAGGYPNVARQQRLIEQCAASKPHAVIVGSVSYAGFSEQFQQIAQTLPVVAAVNDVANPGISAKAGVSWVSMGQAAGAYLAKRHPKGSQPVKVAWFPGPKGAGWVRFVERGFRQALGSAAVQLVSTKWGDTGKHIQVDLVEELLDEVAQLDYIVGSAPAAEAAVSVLRARGMMGQVGIISTYLTHAVYRGIMRGRILAAPTDFPVLQGRLAIDLAIRAIEKNLQHTSIGPAIHLVEQGNLQQIGPSESLAPAEFVATFWVK